MYLITNLDRDFVMLCDSFEDGAQCIREYLKRYYTRETDTDDSDYRALIQEFEDNLVRGWLYVEDVIFGEPIEKYTRGSVCKDM